jgi:hypothetical protein
MPARVNFNTTAIRQRLDLALQEGAKVVLFDLQRTMRKMLDNEGKGRIYSRNTAGERIMSRLGLSEGQMISSETRAAILNLGGRRARAPRGGSFGGMTPSGGRIISAVSQGRKRVPTPGSWVAARGLREKSVGIHRASLPGDPPAKDTGRLINSTQTRQQNPKGTGIMRRKRQGTRVGWTLTFGVKYAKYLERGIGVAPRPFVRPSIQLTKQRAPRLMASMLRRFGFGISAQMITAR